MINEQQFTTTIENYEIKPDLIFLRVDELSLKKNNRKMFEQILENNIIDSLNGLSYRRVLSLRGGFLIELKEDTPVAELLLKISTVAGISWYTAGWSRNRDLDLLAQTALEAGANLWKEKSSFAVQTQRSDKRFDCNSVECNEKIGAIINQATNLQVDLDNPDIAVNIHILKDRAVLFFDKHEGFRGLPVKSSGDVLLLLSGGIDSPVSALRMFRRGCRIDFLHFYNYNSEKQAVRLKIGELVSNLARFGTRGRLYLVPDMPFKLASPKFPNGYEMVLFRRHIVRIAEMIIASDGQQALVTGESLGQVASQTIENITTISKPARHPILRPLIGMTKLEIIDFARKWGTYRISTKKYKDCCAIIARHPKIKSSPERVAGIENDLEIDKIDRQAYQMIHQYEYNRSGIIKPE